MLWKTEQKPSFYKNAYRTFYAFHRIPETAEEDVPGCPGTAACTGGNGVLESSTGRLPPSKTFLLVDMRAPGENIM